MSYIKKMLEKARTIAMVSLSPNPDRDSGVAAKYLPSRGYTVIPINPVSPEVFGLKPYDSLLDIPKNFYIDVVDVFRKTEAIPKIAQEAVQIGASYLWLQLGYKE